MPKVPRNRYQTRQAMYARINSMHRFVQSPETEVIQLGYNCSTYEIVECAIQEDFQAMAITSYRGGYIENLK